MKDFYIYILKCSDGTYYTGHTDNIEKRLAEHISNSYKCYTSTRLPIELVYLETFASRYEALEAERKIKKWGKRKKDTLVTKGWNGIVELRKKNRIE